MKKQLSFFLVILLLTNNLILCFHNTVKTETIVDIMKSFMAKPHRRQSDDSDDDSSSSPPVAPDSKVLSEVEKLAVVNANWIQISSPIFKDETKFPPIILPDYSVKQMQLNSNNYRINESFDEKSKTNPNFPPDRLSFWFRISDKNIYYTNTPTSVNILGSIPLNRIVGVTPERAASSTCFDIADNDDSKWKLCTETKIIRQTWVCYINDILKIDDDDCKKVADSDVIVEDTKVTDAVILIPLPSKVCNDDWNYKQQGKDWECDCKEGKTQSPINLISNTATRSPVKPVFKYQEVVIDPNSPTPPPHLKYSEGSVRLKWDNMGKVITLDGAVYNAVEIVFHTPSQHQIDGRQYDLEVEIIHTGQTKEVIAQYLIVSILFESKAGVYNKFFDDIDFFNLPNPLSAERDLKNNFQLPHLLYDLDSDEFPSWKPFSFFTYEGSLTAPPCTERTIHYVKASTIPLGNTTIQLFKESIKVPDLIDASGNITINNTDPQNFRELQPLNGRRVYYYDYVMQNILNPIKKPAPLEGHYERVAQKMTNYFKVSTNMPSGLPGAFVVSSKEARGG